MSNPINALAQSESVIQELRYDLAPSFSQGVRKYNTHIWSNQASNALGLGTECQFFIPSDPNSVVLNSTVCLRFNVVVSPGAGGTLSDILLSSGYSFLDGVLLSGTNGLPIDQIASEYSKIMDHILKCTISREANFALSGILGTDGQTGLGLAVAGAAANSTDTLSFCLPLMCGFFGVNASSKYFPLLMFEDLLLTIRFQSVLSRIFLGSDATAANRAAAISITDLQLCFDTLQLTPALAGALMSSPNVVLKSNTYRITSKNLPAGSSGSQVLNIPTRCRSLKSMFVIPSITSGTIPAEGAYYNGVNPNLRQCRFVFNGLTYPNSGPLLVDTRPSELLWEIKKGFGGHTSFSDHLGLLSRNNYYVRDVGNPLYTAYNETVANLVNGTQGNMFRVGLDLEMLDPSAAERVLSAGLDISQDNSQVEMDISTALANGYQIWFIAHMDTYLSIEPMTKTFSVTI